MKAIGGFLGLEQPAGKNAFHAGAVALASGRACWHAILQQVRPRRVLVPFYVCDAVLQPVAALGIPCEFYAIDEAWLPERVQPADGDLLLAVNYFGLLSAGMETLVNTYPGQVVVDDTQAYFRTGGAAAWSFNSARKFFGVPDGGYLYGAVTPGHRYPASTTGDCEHLLARAAGDEAAALRLYREHESRIGIEIRGMAPVSKRLLAAVDVEAVRSARRANFRAVHARLSGCNRTGVALDEDEDEDERSPDVPMCYPFLPDVPIAHQALWERKVFVPQYWPEVSARPAGGFARERRLAAELMPLPIDQRYGPDDMSAMCDRVLDAMAGRAG